METFIHVVSSHADGSERPWNPLVKTLSHFVKQMTFYPFFVSKSNKNDLKISYLVVFHV